MTSYAPDANRQSHDKEIAMTTITRPQLTDPNNSTDAHTTAESMQTRARGRSQPAARVRIWRVVLGEWIKFRSVRSAWVTLLSAGAATVAFGMIFSALVDSDQPAPGPAALLSNPVDLALGGVGLAEMIIGVLGVMFVAGEYSTGLIRTSFAAVGRRSKVISAKVAVLGSASFVVSGLAATAAIAAGQAVYSGTEATIPLIDAADVIFGTAYYLTGIALMGLALGFILRSTAGGIATLVGGVFIGPNLLNLLPDSITDVFLRFLPSEAGSAIMTQVSNPDLLSRSGGYAVFTAWVAGLLLLAGRLVTKNDA